MHVNCHYWGQDAFVLNLGDALVPLILRALGHDCAPGSGAAVNAGRTLLVIGSLLDDADLDRIAGPIDVWGCGWRGGTVSDRNLERVTFHGVRGPLTARALGLSGTVPQSDPGFLMPRILPPPAVRHGRRLVIPHCLRVRTQRPAQRLAATGADGILSPWVARRQARLTSASLQQAARRLVSAAVWPRGVESSVRALAGAHFVLTGSLHGAILCQAYGTPWAAYEDDGIDAPAKWQDLAALLDIDIALVRTVGAGEAWWDRTGQWARPPELEPFLAAFPYPSEGTR